MTVKPKQLSRPWWNYVRFSLRAMIVVVLLIGCGLGWVVRSAHVQRDAVAAIGKAGGIVSYDWEWSNGKSIPGGKPWAPKWLVDLIGVDYFGHVTSVWLEQPATDGAIVEVGHLTQLERLQLVGGFVSDGELAHLKGLTKLSNLCLSNVSDAGLAHLKGLTKLKGLILGGHSGHRCRASASEGADQARGPPARRPSGHRCRASASEGADQTPAFDPRWNPGHRRRAGAYQGLERPLPPLAR